MVKGGVWWSRAAQQDASAHVRVYKTHVKVRSWKAEGQVVLRVASVELWACLYLKCFHPRADTNLLYDPSLITFSQSGECSGWISWQQMRLLRPDTSERVRRRHVPPLYLFSNTRLSVFNLFLGPASSRGVR